MDARVVATSIFLGLKAAAGSTSLDFLREVRVVLFKIKVFLAFKQQAMQMFPLPSNNTGVQALTTITHPPLIQNDYDDSMLTCDLSLAEPVAELQYEQHKQPHSSVTEEINQLVAASAKQKSNFLILGCSRSSIDEAMTRLRSYYEEQCTTLTFAMEELSKLSLNDVKDIALLIGSKRLFLEKKHDSQGNIVMVTGLKDAISQLNCLVNTFITRELRKELRAKEEDDLYTRVTWCFCLPNGNWTKFPKKANYNLESKEVAQGIVDAQGRTWNVDIRSMEVTMRSTNQRAQLKRLRNLSGGKKKTWVDDTLYSSTLWKYFSLFIYLLVFIFYIFKTFHSLCPGTT